MAMTVIANALVFHESLAEIEFQVPEAEGGPTSSPIRSIQLEWSPSGWFSPRLDAFVDVLLLPATPSCNRKAASLRNGAD